MKNAIIAQMIFNFLFFGVFFMLTIQSVQNYGWNFLAILSALIATFDFVRGTKLLRLYIAIKKRNK